MVPPALRHPTAPSQVRGCAVGQGFAARDAESGFVQLSNHGPELRGSTPGFAPRCFLKLRST
jgi:hypothetical protein